MPVTRDTKVGFTTINRNPFSFGITGDTKMPAELLMVGVDWYGPFSSLRTAKTTSVNAGVTEFLYFAISTDGKDQSYVGLSKSVETRLTEGHHVLGGLNDGEIDLWVGIVSSQTEAGRPHAKRPVSHSESVEVAEHMMAYFLQTSHNKSKRSNCPGRSAAVFSRWFRPMPPWLRWSHRAHQKWPDFIEFEAEEQTAQLVWFGGKRITYDAEQIGLLRRKSQVSTSGEWMTVLRDSSAFSSDRPSGRCDPTDPAETKRG
jgi:hypothetical protein